MQATVTMGATPQRVCVQTRALSDDCSRIIRSRAKEMVSVVQSNVCLQQAKGEGTSECRSRNHRVADFDAVN